MPRKRRRNRSFPHPNPWVTRLSTLLLWVDLGLLLIFLKQAG
ncbi:hypothetical protein [Deinococcus betulae]|nr:hypothetical protein [Deinococcus betulae]